MAYLGLFALILFTWTVLITIASLLAVIPFFMLGCAGKIWEFLGKRTEMHEPPLSAVERGDDSVGDLYPARSRPQPLLFTRKPSGNSPHSGPNAMIALIEPHTDFEGEENLMPKSNLRHFWKSSMKTTILVVGIMLFPAAGNVLRTLLLWSLS
jgi:hypothetical protein